MVMVVRKYRFIIATVISAMILLLVIACIFSIDNESNKMATDYLKSLGWKIEEVPVEISHIKIPEVFDPAFTTYNAVQTECGFDLMPFRGKTVMRYSYRVLNHKRSKGSSVLAGILVYDGRIIGGDISSTDMNGFMHSVCETSNIQNP